MKKLFALGLIVSMSGALACGGEKKDEMPAENEETMEAPMAEEPEMAPPVSEPMAEEPMGDQMGDDVQVPGDTEPMTEGGE